MHNCVIIIISIMLCFGSVSQQMSNPKHKQFKRFVSEKLTRWLSFAGPNSYLDLQWQVGADSIQQ